MTEDRLEDLIDGATDLLAECDAMDPKQATKQDSIEFLEAIEFWVSSQLEALRVAVAREGSHEGG